MKLFHYFSICRAFHSQSNDIFGFSIRFHLAEKISILKRNSQKIEIKCKCKKKYISHSYFDQKSIKNNEKNIEKWHANDCLFNDSF